LSFCFYQKNDNDIYFMTNEPTLIVHTIHLYTVSQKNDTDVAHYNYDTREGILIIFGRYVAKEIRN